ncbi:hypothetical protein TWF225_006444 [Orbilia oligospora]|uniref:Uncharacterized protein n=1 Tax=Orbilia oligospora TaxID=2813651 RepID=A0A8H2DMY8_ORBOL|nr:hypothetical protein TWF225_006444 [Orbilia oligospora]KAF3255647.1 hypothetical protein TWF217_006476 [Orbilia oligospora]KAF3256294.1 hypothetical protein TWF128_005363 [Orbilia oligospora]KAF3256295.1 hypothetical protein TWF128_005363 [Orbilia oligospora]KAF3290598.1 hypothetical protein TWF132_006913 [Orbilia oligospora]
MSGDRNRQGDFSRVSRTGRVYRTGRVHRTGRIHRTDPALPQYTNINITTSAPDPLRPINEFEHTQAPQRLTNSYQGREYELVRVLILFFEYNDLNIKPETTQFKATCESLGYEVTVYEIKMKDSWKYLEEELRKVFPIQFEKTELRIIYYDGHGGINYNSSLTLASHTFSKSMQEMVNALPQSVRDQSDALQDIAEVNWRDIVNMVNAMECDTLAILDCCDAGAGATTTSLAEEDEQVIGYRKELIGACGWRAEARYHMTPTLCSVLRSGLREVKHSMSISTLIRRMNNRMVGIGEAAPQAVHYLLRRNTVGKIILPRLEAIIPPDERDIYESFNDKSLKGYNALILGGDTGIGRSAAITFSRSGADVTIFYRAYEADQAMPENPKNDAQAIVELAKEWGGKVRLCQFRRNRSGAISLDSLKSHGQADTKFEILVNNFGYKFEDDNGENIFSAEGYDSAARLTFLEGNEVVKAALPFMKPGSKIINTVSLEQSDGPFSKKEYETAARVVEYLTKYQATQGEYKGHTITAILPGVEWPLLIKEEEVEEEEVVLSPPKEALKVLYCFLSVASLTRRDAAKLKITGTTFHIGREG